MAHEGHRYQPDKGAPHGYNVHLNPQRDEAFREGATGVPHDAQLRS